MIALDRAKHGFVLLVHHNNQNKDTLRFIHRAEIECRLSNELQYIERFKVPNSSKPSEDPYDYFAALKVVIPPGIN